jgi:ABC-type transport system substrate-binding protein
MTKTRKGLAAVAGIGVLALGLAACGGGGDSGSGGEDGTPKKGGTLKIVGAGDVDHLDTASSYYTVSNWLGRTWTRQLVSYKASNNFEESISLTADLATEVPSEENGGISPNGKTYTFKLRDGAQFNTQPARDIVAGDVVRGLKRLCNPARPSGGIAYYQATIKGMTAYCKGYEKVDKKSAKAMADYQNKTDIAGVSAPDDKTLKIELVQPATDFLNMMAMNFASPAPKEYDEYVPDSAKFRQNTVSMGPYQITKYAAGKEIQLEHNPAWKEASDPLRKQWVEKIQIQQGQESPDAVQQQIEAGTVHLSWDHPVPVAAISRLKAKKDEGLVIHDGSNTNPMLWFNQQSPNNDGAMAKLKVRQAINYVIDKDALVKIYGGPDLNVVLNNALPPGSLGFKASNTYATPGSKGDANKCKQLLGEAGYPNGFSLKLPYRTNSFHPQVAQSVSADLKKCGIKTELASTTPDDFYGKFLDDPEKAKAGQWDIAAPGWLPDWYGNNGRSVIQPLFDGRHYAPGSPNYGKFNSDKVNKIIDKALTAKTTEEAAAAWAEADAAIVAEAPTVPFMSQKSPLYHAESVKNTLYIPQVSQYDLTQLWLDE